MKVAIVTPGGVDRSGTRRVIPALLDLISRLARRHEVHVFALFQEESACEYELSGARIHCLAKGSPYARTLRAILAEHARTPFEVLHGFWIYPGGLVAAIAGGLLGVKSVVHVAGGEMVNRPDIGFGGSRSMRGRILVRMAMLLADSVTAASSPVLSDVARVGRSALRVPLGVDTARFKQMQKCAGDGEESKCAMAVGSVNRVKDFATLVRAFAAFQRERPEWRLKVVGEDLLDGEVAAMARDLGVGDRVELTGFVTHDLVARMLTRADMLVVSSLYEAGPVCAVEAAAAGVPIVGTAVGHLVDWERLGVPTCPPGEPAALAHAMEVVAARRDGSEVVSRLRDWASSFDADWTAAEFERIYRES